MRGSPGRRGDYLGGSAWDAKLDTNSADTLRQAVAAKDTLTALYRARGDSLAKDTASLDTAVHMLLTSEKPLLADDSAAHSAMDAAATKLHVAHVHEFWLGVGALGLALLLILTIHR